MLLPMPAIGATPRYAYTKIADTVGDLREIGINNSGTVVFLALFDAGGRAIISGNEQRLLIVADTRGQIPATGINAVLTGNKYLQSA